LGLYQKGGQEKKEVAKQNGMQTDELHFRPKSNFSFSGCGVDFVILFSEVSTRRPSPEGQTRVDAKEK